MAKEMEVHEDAVVIHGDEGTSILMEEGKTGEETLRSFDHAFTCRSCGDAFVMNRLEHNRVCPHCNHENKEQSIELDCAPGSPRPGDLIGGVIEGLGIPAREAGSKVFGCWMWNYDDIDEATWETAKLVIKARITDLYYRGLIRYGSW